MKVLIIGKDNRLFEKESPVLSRAIDYGKGMEELHIVAFTLRKDSLKPFTINNLHVYPTNSLSQWFYVLDACNLGKKIIENWKLKIGNCRDVVISTQDPFQMGFVGVWLSKKFKLPLQVQIHTDFLSKYFSKSSFNLVRIKIASYVIPRAQGIRVVSGVIKDSLRKYYPNLGIEQDVLPVFIDIEKMVLAEPKGSIKTDFPKFKFIILMASRLTREKKIEVALSALKKVTNLFPDVGLVVSGDGPEKNNLKAITQKLGLTNNVIFSGWNNDLISYYKTADLFLLTSEYEGYGMTLIEAGASGCPIVTTKVGIASTNLFEDNKNSCVCPVGDINCITESIIGFLVDDAKGELFKHKMQDSIRKVAYSNEEYTARYVALLENLLKNA